MASTYSPALRLELMATGDQSGTWGDTTNTNLGTLLEQAITGYLSVAQGDVANLTLTTVNGGTDQARNAVVRITGALTATRNVVVQTANKLYTIANDTTGGFSIVVKTSGGTGVSVPPGAMMNVYSDGTNVVMGQNYWSGSIGGAIYLDAGAAVGPIYDLFRDSTSPAASDIIGAVQFNGRDSAGNKQNYAQIDARITSPTSTTETGSLHFQVTTAGALLDSMTLTPTALVPTTNSLLALGTTSLGWGSLFGATGFTFNIANGDWVATHTSGILTVGTGDLRVTTAGANTASVVTVGGTQTLTNKTLTSPSINAVTGAVVATQADQETATSTSVLVSPGRQQFHPSAAKCWVKCTATGSIIDSYNITSVTDTGTGVVTVTIATDFSGTGYALASSVQASSARAVTIDNSPVVGSFVLMCFNSSWAAADPTAYHASAFGDQ